MDRSLRQSYRAALVLFGYLVLVKVVLTVAAASSPGFRSPSQTAVFAWPALGILFVLGAGAIWLNHRVELHPLWDPAIPLARRLTQPALVGILLGCLSVTVDYVTGWAAASAQKMGVPSIHIPWPNSLLIYPGGAIIVNTIYYLIPIPLICGLVKLVTKRSGPPSAPVFWTAGVIAALIEPATQVSAVPGHPMMTYAFFGQGFLENLAQVWAYRRAGWVSSVVLRIAFYLVWHVLWGLR
jgi:hypothetical protein